MHGTRSKSMKMHNPINVAGDLLQKKLYMSPMCIYYFAMENVTPKAAPGLYRALL